MWATNLGKSVLLAWVGIATIIFASFLPWGKVWFVTVNGIDGDGKITAVLGVASALLFGFARIRAAAWRKGLALTSLIASLLAAAVYIYDFFNLSTTGGSDEELFDIEVTIGIGLYLGVAGSLLAIAATAFAVIERTRTPA